MSSNRKERLSRLMHISWEIQKTKSKDRSKALAAAWAIVNNEDVTVHYLVRKLNRYKPLPGRAANQFHLFY